MNNHGYTTEDKQMVLSESLPATDLLTTGEVNSEPNLVAALWRYRGTFILVSLLSSLIIIPAIWMMLKPKYEVSAMIHVAPFVRPILFSDPNVDITRDYRQYMGTEAATVVSLAIIDAALSRPEIRSLPIVQEELDPVMMIGTRMTATHLPGTQLLKVFMVGEHADELELIVNAVVDTYFRRNNEKQRDWDEKILSSLRREESELEAKLEIKAMQLQRTAVDHGLGGAEPSGASLDAWMGELRQLLTEAKKEKAIAQAKIEARRKALELQNEGDYDTIYESADFVNYLVQHPILQSLKEQLRQTELSSLDDKRLGRGPEHPDVQGRPQLTAALRMRIDAKEKELAETFMISHKRSLKTNLNTLKEQYNDARVTVMVLSDELNKLTEQRSDVAGQLFILENLRHERQRLEDSLRMVKEKVWNVEVEQNRAQRITLESPAQSPKKPNIDKRIKYSAVAMMLCFFSGMGVAMIRSRLDTSFQNSTEVAQRLGVRVLGSVEFVEYEFVGPQTMDRRIAEPIRGISAALLASSNGSGAHTRLITSPAPGTGKSSLASNLAYSLAATGRSVLLIDADNEGRGVTRLMQMQEFAGLTELLMKDMSPDSLVRATDDPRLFVLPSGKRNVRFGEMLSNLRNQQRLTSLFHQYDEVIFDSPPVLTRSDAVLIASLVQDVILVLRAGQSTHEEAVTAQQYLSSVGANVVGVILNAVDPKNARYGYGYSYAENDLDMNS